ncbi:hypothetical protein AeMF1_003942 [Aphanomyces euteiches]|nr:hypothetical protein AeMF1_003942 [Aphanomyces euteiches]
MERERERLLWSRLPLDIIVKIAFSIPDTEDLFAFLEALRPAIDLGPLEHLNQLGPTKSDLWPSLRLNASILDLPTRSSFEAIAQYYSNVIVEDVWENVGWLKSHLNPTAKIVWAFKKYKSPVDRMDDWSDLRITRLVSSRRYKDPPVGWAQTLSRLPFLTSLTMDDATCNLDEAFEFLCNSENITELQITDAYYRMTASSLLYLAKWFRQHPVQKFECVVSHFASIDKAVRQEFCQALLNCSTLDRVKLPSCYLEDLDFSLFRFEMMSLELCCGTISSDYVMSLAHPLEGSKVTRLALNACDDEDLDGIECLLDILPRTLIKHLAFEGLTIDDNPSWSKVVPLFEYCKLETLVLKCPNIPSAFAQGLAVALRHNQTICELDLQHCDIDSDDVRLLIESVTHSSRQVAAKRIKLRTTKTRWRRGIEDSIVMTLKEFATVCGGEFVNDW